MCTNLFAFRRKLSTTIKKNVIIISAICIVPFIAFWIGCQRVESFSWKEVYILPTYGSINYFADEKCIINLGLMTRKKHEAAFLSSFESVNEIATDVSSLYIIPQTIGVSAKNADYTCYTLVAELRFSILPETYKTIEKLYVNGQEFALGSLGVVPFKTRARPLNFKIVRASGTVSGLGIAPYSAEFKVTGQDVTLNEILVPAYSDAHAVITRNNDTIDLNINFSSAEEVVIFYISPIIKYNEDDEVKEYPLDYFTCGVFLSEEDVSKIGMIVGIKE